MRKIALHLVLVIFHGGAKAGIVTSCDESYVAKISGPKKWLF